jgi:hypothetical protein
MLAKSWPVDSKRMVFVVPLISDALNVIVLHVVHEPVGWNVMFCAVPLINTRPVRAELAPSANRTVIVRVPVAVPPVAFENCR